MTIKDILDEIANESSTNQKMVILKKYKDNELLKKVLYMALSKRVKFFLKQIPEYTPTFNPFNTLEDALRQIQVIADRKVTGYDAINHLKSTLQSLTADDAYVIERIIEKDLKIGMGRTFINKVIPDLIEKTPYQGAKPYDERLAEKIFEEYRYAYSDIKMDGRYANAIIQNGEVELESRQGETTFIPSDSLLIKELSTFDDGVLNGELTMVGLDRYTANGIIASIIDIEEGRDKRSAKETEAKISAFEKKNGPYKENVDKIRYTVWDSITLDDYFNKKSEIPYRKRLKYLYQISPLMQCSRVSIVERKKVYSYEDAIVHFQDALQRGLEGTILKAPLATWKDGKPNWQVKMKLEMNVDLRIVGFKYGEKGTKNESVISTLNVESSCGLLKTNPSGMDEAMMKYVTENQDKLLGSVVEIRCCGLSQNSDGDWSTLHPSVVELRDDKDTCDSLQSAQAIEDMAKGLTKILA